MIHFSCELSLYIQISEEFGTRCQIQDAKDKIQDAEEPNLNPVSCILCQTASQF